MAVYRLQAVLFVCTVLFVFLVLDLGFLLHEVVCLGYINGHLMYGVLILIGFSS